MNVLAGLGKNVVITFLNCYLMFGDYMFRMAFLLAYLLIKKNKLGDMQFKIKSKFYKGLSDMHSYCQIIVLLRHSNC